VTGYFAGAAGLGGTFGRGGVFLGDKVLSADPIRDWPLLRAIAKEGNKKRTMFLNLRKKGKPRGAS